MWYCELCALGGYICGVIPVVGFGRRLADVSGGTWFCGLRFWVWVMFSILVTFVVCAGFTIVLKVAW